VFGFLVRAKVVTAHTLPPAAIHRHPAVGWGPRTKATAARAHPVIAELARTTQDSSRITILTRYAPARPANGADPRDGHRAAAGVAWGGNTTPAHRAAPVAACPGDGRPPVI
jgi:hypothetical protein